MADGKWPAGCRPEQHPSGGLAQLTGRACNDGAPNLPGDDLERAARIPKFHYTTGYAFYSSFEHSDAMALNAYIADWDEVGPRINAGPSDDHVAVALGHNATVLADVLLLYCRSFKIERPDIFEKIQTLLN